MLIRSEIGIDAAGIDALLRRCFATGAEADLVQRLREDGQLTLGQVVTDEEGLVLGYAAFSPVTLSGEDCGWVALAPMAVDASLRHQGMGQQLIYEALDVLNEFGYAAVVVVGDPHYFSRYGFEPAAEHGVYCPWPDTRKTFQVYILSDHAANARGCVEFADHFNDFR